MRPLPVLSARLAPAGSSLAAAAAGRGARAATRAPLDKAARTLGHCRAARGTTGAPPTQALVVVAARYSASTSSHNGTTIPTCATRAFPGRTASAAPLRPPYAVLASTGPRRSFRRQRVPAAARRGIGAVQEAQARRKTRAPRVHTGRRRVSRPRLAQGCATRAATAPPAGSRWQRAQALANRVTTASLAPPRLQRLFAQQGRTVQRAAARRCCARARRRVPQLACG